MTYSERLAEQRAQARTAMQEALDRGDWDTALEKAKRLPPDVYREWPSEHRGIPDAVVHKILDRVQHHPEALSEFLHYYSSNAPDDASAEVLQRAAKLANDHDMGYIFDAISQYPNWRLSDEDMARKKATDFWHSYEREVKPDHFAAISSYYSGKPEKLKVHRPDQASGSIEGDSETFRDALPHLARHSEEVQALVRRDPDIQKKWVGDKLYIKAYRGVGGAYGQALKQKARHDERTNEIDKRSLTVPSGPFTSWSTNFDMACHFAHERGKIPGQPAGHGVVIEAWMPVEHLLHSGFHHVHAGQEHPHADEYELIFGHPTGRMKIETANLHFQLPDQRKSVVFKGLVRGKDGGEPVVREGEHKGATREVRRPAPAALPEAADMGDYSHLLPDEYRSQGYKLGVFKRKHPPDSWMNPELAGMTHYMARIFDPEAGGFFNGTVADCVRDPGMPDRHSKNAAGWGLDKVMTQALDEHMKTAPVRKNEEPPPPPLQKNVGALRPLLRAMDPAGRDLVNHEGQMRQHPAVHQRFVDNYRTHVLAPDGPTSKVNLTDGNKAVIGINEPLRNEPEGVRYLIKPYHQEVSSALSDVLKHPVQGWAEMASQHLFHAAQLGHLYQPVHVAEHNLGPGHEREPMLVIRMHPGFQHVADGVEWSGEDTPGPRARAGWQLKGATDETRRDARKIALMSFLTNDWDLNSENLLSNDKGQLVRIDGGNAFQYMTPGHPEFHGKPEAGDRFGDYLFKDYGAIRDVDPHDIESHEGRRGLMEAYRPALDWWWGVRGPVRQAMQEQLEHLRDPILKAHIQRNFEERAGWLDSMADGGLERAGDRWYDDEIPIHGAAQ